MRKDEKKKTRPKRSKFRFIIGFLIFQLLFTAVSAPFIIFYGPFDRLKKIVVGASMSSYSHQYIAKAFLSQQEINRILYDGVVSSGTPKQKLGSISVFSHDDSIECKKIEGRKFDGYLLVVHDPTRVKVGYTKKLGIQGEKTSEIAQEYQAVAAINAGGFTDKSANSKAKWTGTGAYPEGIVISDGKVIYPQNDLDREKTISGCIAGITEKGLLVIGEYTLGELEDQHVRDAIAFGPPLIVNGTAQKNIVSQGTAPRTAIGQRQDGAILLLVVDGRQTLKAGATIKDVQNILLQEGAYNAVNLDGGASATMYYKGEVINTPSDKFGERPIPTIFYVK